MIIQGHHKIKKTHGDRVHKNRPKKYKPVDSDEHDEERENWPGPSSNSQATVPVQPLQQRPAANSQGPVASTNTGDEDCEYSSGRTVLYPDLYVLTNDEHWAMTPETHKYAAAAGSLFRDNGKWKTTRHLQFDHYAVCTTIIVPD